MKKSSPLVRELIYRVSKRGEAPLLKTSPLSFKGERDKGGEVDKQPQTTAERSLFEARLCSHYF